MVGLDIGTDSIKVAEAKFARDGITISGLGIARTPEGVFDNELIVDPKALGQAIKALLAESGVKTKKCVSSVSGSSQVVVRVISVPKMNQDELAETMKWEVERHVPFSPQEVVMDFQPLNLPSADPAASEMDILLAVAQQQLIDSHVEALLEAGLKPVAIDVESLAASRALVELSDNGAQNETVAVVNIGATRTDLGVFENGILTFPSPPIGVAGINFTREISEAMGQTLEDAEITKREYAAVNLSGFQAAQEPDDTPAPPPVAETTVFDTVFTAPTDTTPAPEAETAFDLGDSTGQDDFLAAEAADPNEFMPTDDGPMFDLDDGAGPSFDLDSGPSFDLGESADDTISGGPAFDLDDDEPELQPETPADPNFDLSDAGAETDHGREAVLEPNAPKLADLPIPAPIGFEEGSTEAVVFKAISGVLVDLANELRMSLDYYFNRYSKMPDRVFLCGGTARIPNLDIFLSQELGVPVEVADPVKNVAIKVPSASEQYLQEISPMLSVSIGLAIRDMIG